MSDASPPLSKLSFNVRAREWGSACAVSLCVAVAVIAPFFWLGTASGHDVSFHMASWLDVAGQWKEGVLFPRWAEWANFGFGEPRFIFYPPLSWLLGAFLGSFLPWTRVALVFNLSVQTFGGVSAYALLRRIAEQRFAALCGAACFAANPYALLIVYMRSDFAELAAIALFPLLLLATLRLSGLLIAEAKTGRFLSIFLFALVFAAVWLSNAPAAVIATYSVSLLFALAAARRRSARPMVAGAAGIALGFCLAGFYLIPAIYEQRWVNISGALADGLRPSDNFLFARTGDSDHDAFNHIASKLAILLSVWACVAAVAAWRSQPVIQNRLTGVLRSFVTLAAAAGLLMLPITLVLWNLAPELRFVQFPWRWSSILAVCAITLTTISLQGKLRWIWPVGVTIALAACGSFLVRHAWWDTEDMPTLQAAVQNSEGFEGTDEYDPAGDDRSELAQKQPRAEMPEAKIAIERWDAEHRTIRVVARRPGHLAVRLLDFPAWKATVNDKPVNVLHASGTDQMVVPVPEGRSEVRLEFTRTCDRTVGGWLSIASVFGSLAALIVRRRAAVA